MNPETVVLLVQAYNPDADIENTGLATNLFVNFAACMCGSSRIAHICGIVITFSY